MQIKDLLEGKGPVKYIRQATDNPDKVIVHFYDSVKGKLIETIQLTQSEFICALSTGLDQMADSIHKTRVLLKGK